MFNFGKRKTDRLDRVILDKLYSIEAHIYKLIKGVKKMSDRVSDLTVKIGELETAQKAANARDAANDAAKEARIVELEQLKTDLENKNAATDVELGGIIDRVTGLIDAENAEDAATPTDNGGGDNGGGTGDTGGDGGDTPTDGTTDNG